MAQSLTPRPPAQAVRHAAAPAHGGSYGASHGGAHDGPQGTYGTTYAAPSRRPAPERPAPAGPGAPGAPTGGTPATLGALLDALRSERKLLDDLATTMGRQRAAVGRDDLEAVDDSVFATHRILATLGQARLRRRAVNRLVAGVEDLPLRALDDVLGGQMTDEIRAARDGLQASAEALSRQVDVNRRVLREALAAGDAHARVLAGAGASIDGPGAAATARALLDRTV